MPKLVIFRRQHERDEKAGSIWDIRCGVFLPIAFLACMFPVAVGGASFGVATQFNLNLVEGLVCPEGSEITYREGPLETSYEPPSTANPLGGETSGRSFWVQCVADRQVVASGNGILVRTLASILGAYFLACFPPLFVLLSGIFLLLQRTLLASKENSEPVGEEQDST